jgi:hypothetical protein
MSKRGKRDTMRERRRQKERARTSSMSANRDWLWDELPELDGHVPESEWDEEDWDGDWDEDWDEDGREAENDPLPLNRLEVN